jgi:hypothetical protein
VKKKFLFQIRMDFNSFVIAGPSTLTVSLGKQLNGAIGQATGIAYNSATTCQTDTFTVTGTPGAVPPVICGTNSGYHGNHLVLCMVFGNINNINRMIT